MVRQASATLIRREDDGAITGDHLFTRPGILANHCSSPEIEHRRTIDGIERPKQEDGGETAIQKPPYQHHNTEADKGKDEGRAEDQALKPPMGDVRPDRLRRYRMRVWR